MVKRGHDTASTFRGTVHPRSVPPAERALAPPVKKTRRGSSPKARWPGVCTA